jgi:hypothetical protein
MSDKKSVKNEPAVVVAEKHPLCRRKCCGLCALLLIVVAGLGAWIMCRSGHRPCGFPRHDFVDVIKRMDSDLQDMRRQLAAVVANQNSEKCANCTGLLRKKWKAWMALLSKIQANEPLNDELQKFGAVFADDKEILKLVDDYLKYVGYESYNAAPGPLESCRKFLKKIVRFRKNDRAKLREICGHVLSSSSCR